MVNQMQEGLVSAPFTLSKSTDDVAWMVNGDIDPSSNYETIFSYSVPLGTAIQILPRNYIFGFYYDTVASTEGNLIKTGETRLTKSNANGSDTRQFWAGQNNIFKDVGDVRQRPSITIPLLANASQKINVQIKGMGTTLDKDYSDFFIECIQFYEKI
jgi:hypothetical protein